MSGVCRKCQQPTENAYIFGILRKHIEYIPSMPSTTTITPIALVKIYACDTCGPGKAEWVAEKEYFKAEQPTSVNSRGTIPAEDIIFPENSGDIDTQSWQKNSRALSGSSQCYSLIPEKRLRNDKYIKFKRFLNGKKTGHIALREWLEKVVPDASDA